MATTPVRSSCHSSIPRVITSHLSTTSVLLGLVHVAAEPMLRDDPQLPAEGLVRVLQAMFVPGLPVVTSKRMVVVVSEQFYNFLFYDNPRLSFSLCVCNQSL